MSELVNYSTGTTVPATWLNRVQLREEGLSEYVVYQVGGTIYAKALLAGGIDYSGSDAATVINQAITAVGQAGRILLRTGTYTLTATLVFPVITPGGVVLEGESAEAVTIVVPNGGTGITLGTASADSFHVTVKHLTLK